MYVIEVEYLMPKKIQIGMIAALVVLVAVPVCICVIVTYQQRV